MIDSEHMRETHGVTWKNVRRWLCMSPFVVFAVAGIYSAFKWGVCSGY